MKSLPVTENISHLVVHRTLCSINTAKEVINVSLQECYNRLRPYMLTVGDIDKMKQCEQIVCYGIRDDGKGMLRKTNAEGYPLNVGVFFRNSVVSFTKRDDLNGNIYSSADKGELKFVNGDLRVVIKDACHEPLLHQFLLTDVTGNNVNLASYHNRPHEGQVAVMTKKLCLVPADTLVAHEEHGLLVLMCDALSRMNGFNVFWGPENTKREVVKLYERNKK